MRTFVPAFSLFVLLPVASMAFPVAQEAPPAPAATLDFAPDGPISDDQLGDYWVEMECAVDGESVGVMSIDLWSDAAPVTVRNFLRYAAEGFYDGKTFHRILRGFMVQGGDPSGNGSGNGPHGMIRGEFSTDAKREHHYGVLSMARTQDPDSASCQFFICCDESAGVWNLDGSYASFGKLVHGVDALEALANVPTESSGREKSQPTKKVTIVRATVKTGKPEQTEAIKRPLPDLNGEPGAVRVQHVLISFAGTGTQATRTKEEAEALAADIEKRARAGEDFESLVREYSDDPSQPNDPAPGCYRMSNAGFTDVASERKMFDLQKNFRAYQEDLLAQVQLGEMETTAMQEMMRQEQTRIMPEVMAARTFPRDGMAKAFGDVAFSLKVGEIGVASFKEEESPFGWHIIKRLE